MFTVYLLIRLILRVSRELDKDIENKKFKKDAIELFKKDPTIELKFDRRGNVSAIKKKDITYGTNVKTKES